MKDLTSSRLIVLKGFLMLLTGVFASALLLWENPGLRVALLLGLALWGFMRFYYFAFYVIEKYVDAQYKFSGLGSFAGYLIRRRKPGETKDAPRK
ncbi:MAG: hypothetical protein ACI9VS_000974 [Candidatus Binatia bacterium]|jgi:hypothetical protein